MNKINKAAKYINNKIDKKPVIGLILGSGLGMLAERIEGAEEILYQDIPGFPVSTVNGHAGKLVIGNLGGKNVAAMQGRLHYYEGYSMKEITLPVRVMKKLGIEILIITNAAGGVNRNFSPGDFMIISDHVNLMGDNPLIGVNLSKFGPRFPDMTEAYNNRLIKIADEAASLHGIILRKGVYAAMSGPTYETPTEIRCLAALDIDAVGMSTVPEVIVARHMGVEVLGISCITNMAAGILAQPLAHSEVMETAGRVKTDFIKLVQSILQKI